MNSDSLILKRIFDISFSLLGLILFFWLILITWVISSFDTRANGLFTQRRVGKNGKIFKIFKIRTMKIDNSFSTSITSLLDSRVTRIGRFFRNTKIDELPQLINILIGQMSFVGPRPDVPGYADKLEPEIQDILLSVRPGVTGPATIFYRNEEDLLAKQDDPEKYNNEVIYPHKVQINLEYVQNLSFKSDLFYILKTLKN